MHPLVHVSVYDGMTKGFIILVKLTYFLCFSFVCYHYPFRIIAEGVPESQTRAFNKVAADKGVGIIGPATVGGIKVSCFLRNE